MVAIFLTDVRAENFAKVFIHLSKEKIKIATSDS